jgi:hypothetical protein
MPRLQCHALLQDYETLFGTEPEPEPEPKPWKPPTQEHKMELIFLKFDADMNGFLNMEETNRLMLQTGHDEYNLKTWKKMCKNVGANPGPGLTVEQFRNVESEFVDLDFTLLFGNTPGLMPPGLEMPEGLDMVQRRAWAKKYSQ